MLLVSQEQSDGVYAVERVGDPSLGLEVFRFKRVKRTEPTDGLVLKVAPRGRDPWVGCFQPGDGSLSGVWPIPRSHYFLAVANGFGYMVDVCIPSATEPIPLVPVNEVRVLDGVGLLVAVGPTGLIGLGSEGVRWQARSVSWDGVRLLNADDSGITGVGWDAIEEREVGFYLNPVTGELEGGSGSP